MRRLAALLLVAAATRASAAPFDADSAAAHARLLTPLLLAQRAGPLWQQFSPGMRGTMRDSTALAAVLRNIALAAGPLDSLLDERVRPTRRGAFEYTAVVHFRRPPGRWSVRFEFDERGRVTGMFVGPGAAPGVLAWPSEYQDYVPKTLLHLPVRGPWEVLAGGRRLDQNGHAAARELRFACDLRATRGGRTHRGDGRSPADYFGFGQPVLAPAAGVVVWTADSIADHPPGQPDAAHPDGNALILDHGNGEYSMIAHLQAGSLRFRVGERVPADAELGRCGNSGDCSEPCVRVHLQNGPSPTGADGLPAWFSDIVVDGRIMERAELERGQQVSRIP